MKILCLSNGHGEDAIAVRIIQELRLLSESLELVALPLVGKGQAYEDINVPIIGPVRQMPSGGFIYMDGRQLVRDVQGGLIQLTLAQFKTVRRWAKEGGIILVVGDIVPLLFAWLSGANYAFVGTAKSEYFIQDEAGILPKRPKWSGWSGSVYLPWERWLMKHQRCKAVFPRDKITTDVLQQFSIPAFDLGNPMMDGILPENPAPIFYEPDAELKEVQRPLIITLLPGSRIPEVYQNWELILQSTIELLTTFRRRSLVFLSAIAPSINLEPLSQIVQDRGWKREEEPFQFPVDLEPGALAFTQANATLILTQHSYTNCLLKGDLAIAMAGTATEQFVGLGKPAIAIPGRGPQYNPTFAEAQTRLLGLSLVLVSEPKKVAPTVQQLLRDPDRLQLIAENGDRRLGKPGAARRIACCLLEQLGR